VKRTVQLGDLVRGRVFAFDGRRFKVAKSLGSVGVSVRPLATRQVRVGERTFTATESRTEVWSASSPVVIEVHEITADDGRATGG